MRKWGLILLGALAALALVGGLLLRSGRIHEIVRARLEAAVNAHIAGSFTMGAVSGPLLGGITMKDIGLRDDRGRELLRLKSFSLTYRTLSLLFRSSFPHARVEGLWIDLPAFKEDRTHFAAYLVELTNKTTDLHDLEAHDFTFELGGERFRRLRVEDARLAVHLTRHKVTGSTEVHDLRGSLTVGDRTLELRLRGSNRWDEHTPIDARDVHLALGKSEVGGRWRQTGKAVAAEITSIHAAPEDLHALVPMEKPPGPIDGTVRVDGPLDKLVAKLDLHPGQGTIRVDGVVDWPAKRLTAIIDNQRVDGGFFPKQPPLVFSGRVQLGLRLDGGPSGSFEISRASALVKHVAIRDAHVNARLLHHAVEVGEVQASIPGARVEGRGTLQFSGAMDLAAHVDVTHPEQLIPLHIGKFSLPSLRRGSAQVSADVLIRRESQGKPKVSVRHLRFRRNVASRPH
jgi:hypothetical protein